VLLLVMEALPSSEERLVWFQAPFPTERASVDPLTVMLVQLAAEPKALVVDAMSVPPLVISVEHSC
jgi:hypothetical protein